MRNLNDPQFIDGDFATGVTAAGTTQGTATTLPANHCIVTTVTDAANGVVLKALARGEVFSVANGDGAGAVGGQALKVYPPSGASFNGMTANDPITLPPGFCAQGRFVSNTAIMVSF